MPPLLPLLFEGARTREKEKKEKKRTFVVRALRLDHKLHNPCPAKGVPDSARSSHNPCLPHKIKGRKG